MKKIEFPICPLCGGTSSLFYEDRRLFYLCANCSLIFSTECSSREEATKQYHGQWQEQTEDFWVENVQVVEHLLRQYEVDGPILDFGAGSEGLTTGLGKLGFDVTPLEPMRHGYLQDQAESFGPFKAVVALEVLEHLPDMMKELSLLKNLLMPNGIIIVSTLMTTPFIENENAKETFSKWWYKDDQTHLSFYCTKSIGVIAQKFDWHVDLYANNLFVFKA